MNRNELHRWAVVKVSDAWRAAGATAEPTAGDADLLVRLRSGAALRVQVWSARRGRDGYFTYGFRPKSKMPLDPNRYVARVHVETGGSTRLYLIPTLAWNEPDRLLVDRNYEGAKSPPEWGLCTTNPHLPALEQRFAWNLQMRKLGLDLLPVPPESGVGQEANGNSGGSDAFTAHPNLARAREDD